MINTEKSAKIGYIVVQ